MKANSFSCVEAMKLFSTLCFCAFVLSSCKHRSNPKLIELDECKIDPSLTSVLPFPRPGCSNADYIGWLAWQTFVALQWQASNLERGKPKSPNVCQAASDCEPLSKTNGLPVWESWKQGWELLPPSHSTKWEQFGVEEPPCSKIISVDGSEQPVTTESWPRDAFVLRNVNMITCSQDDVQGCRDQNASSKEPLPFKFVGPLTTPSGDYVWFGTGFNKSIYDKVRQDCKNDCKCEDLENCPHITLPASHPTSAGSVAVKSAWRVVTNEDEKSRYHWRRVLTLEFDEERQSICREQEMVLLALHVILKNACIGTSELTSTGQCYADKDEYFDKKEDKTLLRNQWIWSTFEHVDLVEGCVGEEDRGFDGGVPQQLPRAPFPPKSNRIPTKLCRVNNFKTATNILNGQFGALLSGTIWENYQLVGFQWHHSGGFTPPEVANVMLEPYSQHDSCAKCHSQKAAPSDFIWGLQNFRGPNTLSRWARPTTDHNLPQ